MRFLHETELFLYDFDSSLHSYGYTYHHLASLENALIVGAGHGIGLEVVKHILKNSDADVQALYSEKSRAKDLFQDFPSKRSSLI